MTQFTAAMGVSLHRSSATRPDIDTQEIARRYLAGESINALAGKFNCSRQTISARLERAGVASRPQALDTYFDRIRNQEACPKHDWCAPFEQNYGYGADRKAMWTVRCTLCGRQANRDTLEQLQTEVLSA